MCTLFRNSLAKISPICSSISARRSCALRPSRNAPNLPPSPVHWTRTRLRRRAWMVNSESLLQQTHTKRLVSFKQKKMVFILTAVSLPFTVIHQNNNNQKCTKKGLRAWPAIQNSYSFLFPGPFIIRGPHKIHFFSFPLPLPCMKQGSVYRHTFMQLGIPACASSAFSPLVKGSYDRHTGRD